MKRILIVDDEPTTRKLVSETLLREGYAVDVCQDGIDALVFLKENKPDLILLDVMMPELTGYDVCHRIKFDPDLKHIPVIILTSRGQELDSRLGAMMGIEYLHKSSYPKELLQQVRISLGEEKVR